MPLADGNLSVVEDGPQKALLRLKQSCRDYQLGGVFLVLGGLLALTYLLLVESARPNTMLTLYAILAGWILLYGVAELYLAKALRTLDLFPYASGSFVRVLRRAQHAFQFFITLDVAVAICILLVYPAVVPIVIGGIVTMGSYSHADKDAISSILTAIGKSTNPYQ